MDRVRVHRLQGTSAGVVKWNVIYGSGVAEVKDSLTLKNCEAVFVYENLKLPPVGCCTPAHAFIEGELIPDEIEAGSLYAGCRFFNGEFVVTLNGSHFKYGKSKFCVFEKSGLWVSEDFMMDYTQKVKEEFSRHLATTKE